VSSAARAEGDDRPPQLEAVDPVDVSAADREQSHSAADQAASDADQVSSQDDQDLADREQQAADLAHAAADRSGLMSEASANAYAKARDARDATKRERGTTAAIRARTTGRRLTTAAQRDDVARLRDLTADSRDVIAQARDDAADARDLVADGRERRAREAGEVDDESYAALRLVRLAAAAVRRESKRERESAATDRAAAAADRQRAEDDRRYSGLDELTGVFRRGTGELALAHEVARARRSKRPLIVAMIDVDGLKPINDRFGHAAGDELLRDVVTAITSTMRSYDVTVRWGGDEFISVLSDVTLEVAEARLDETGRVLDRLRPGSSITAGIAMLLADDDLDTVIARADAALYRAKAQRATSPG
jgi:diguanylate cyclase (GGDEF)-like protein